MTQPQKNTALVCGIVAAVLSLPLTWITIRNAQVQGGFGTMFNPFGGMTFNITGLNGHLTFFVKTPIWFIVSVAIAANILQLMSGSPSFAIPDIAQWGTAIVATLWLVLPVLTTIGSGKATLGIGALLGLASAVIPVVCLFSKPRSSLCRDSTEEPSVP